jgi:dienelactone hydrolase
MRSIVLATLLVAGLAGTAQAEPVASLADGRTGKIEYQSLTPTNVTSFVRRAPDVAKATVFGTLSLPEGTGKVPVMVIAHGSGGVTDAREFAWAKRLAEIGVGAFVFDSFTPRNIRETATDQSQLNTIANVADALFALKLLATHPRVDAKRIGVMGFSKGGQVTLWSALDTVRRGVIADDLRFAVHVAFYPACNTQYVGKPTGAPVAFLVGGSDDYTPPWACERYGAWFKGKGVAVTYTAYSGAYHGFDGSGRAVFLNNLQTGRNCDAELDVDTMRMKRLDTNAALPDGNAISEYFRGCIQRGATVGGDARALSKSADDLKALLRQVFALPG